MAAGRYGGDGSHTQAYPRAGACYAHSRIGLAACTDYRSHCFPSRPSHLSDKERQRGERAGWAVDPEGNVGTLDAAGGFTPKHR